MSRKTSQLNAALAREQSRVQINTSLESAHPIPSASVITHNVSFNSEVTFDLGLKGSLTRLANGNPYLIAGDNVTISSSANGPITISTTQGEAITLSGNDGEVQFNASGNLGADPVFTYDDSTETLSVPSVKGKLTFLPDGTTPFLNVSGVLQKSVDQYGSVTLSRGDYSPSEGAESNATWRSYTPNISDESALQAQRIILPTSKTIAGRYLYSQGSLKLLFNLSAASIAGASNGVGTYKITLPQGYEIDESIVPIGSLVDKSSGLSVGIASVLSDYIGGGKSWSVVPVSSTELVLYGKSPSGNEIISWGADGFPITAGNDLKVSFTATIPAIRMEQIEVGFEGPELELSGGSFRSVKTLNGVGTQFVEGELTFNSGTQIYLYDSVFSQTGQYVLFDYSSGSFPGGQAQLNSNVSVISADLALSEVPSASGMAVLEDQPGLKRIVLKLNSKPTNGKQWIEGDLIINGPVEIILTESLYATPGTYELFEVSGSVSGLNYLTCTCEANLSPGAPFQDGNIIKVTLT